MDIVFEELDYRRTPLGELILRRRTELSLGVVVYEVKLGDAFLMSSLFTEGEVVLAKLGAHLQPGGAFALWSNDPPDEEFRAALASVFEDASAQVVTFHNPLQNRDAANTVYVARAGCD